MREIKFKGNTFRIDYKLPVHEWGNFRASLLLALRSMGPGQILTEHKGQRVFFNK